jgi:hypothetical protein
MFKVDLQAEEKVLNFYRQSEVVLFKPVILVMCLIYFPWYFLLKYELAASYSKLLVFGTILVLVYAINKYLLWLLNVCLVTDKRVMIIKYHSLFNKKVSESPLLNILNVSFTTKGFWQTLFKFGSVDIQTQGLAEPLTFKNVANPSKIKDSLWSAQEKNK